MEVSTSNKPNMILNEASIFESQGYKVIRFWNNQVENDINGVIRAIELVLNHE